MSGTSCSRCGSHAAVFILSRLHTMLPSVTCVSWNADVLSLNRTAERERSTAAHAAPCPLHRGAQGRPESPVRKDR
jgi:hypothetical protein